MSKKIKKEIKRKEGYDEGRKVKREKKEKCKRKDPQRITIIKKEK